MPTKDEFKKSSNLSNFVFPQFIDELRNENLQVSCIKGEVTNVVHTDMQENMDDVENINVSVIIDELDCIVVDENMLKD